MPAQTSTIEPFGPSIFSSAIGKSPGTSFGELSKLALEDFDFLHQLDPAVGITGNSQGHKRPIQQFNTPGLPYAMIGTEPFGKALICTSSVIGSCTIEWLVRLAILGSAMAGSTATSVR